MRMFQFLQSHKYNKKKKLTSILNLLGLIIGITASILLLRYVLFEFSYDKFHENHDDIYRVTYKRSQGSEELYHSVWSFAGIGPSMKENIPELVEYSRIVNWRGNIATKNYKSYDEKFTYASSAYLNMFTIELLTGGCQNLLDEVNTVIISESAALKYFGNKSPVGDVIRLDNMYTFKVVGVFKDIPPNSHIKFDFLFSYETIIRKMGERVVNDWNQNWVINYVQLRKGTRLEVVERKLNELLVKYRSDLSGSETKIELYLQPLDEIHLSSNLKDELDENGSKKVVVTLLIISILIILLAWINFINLSTAKALERAKEVGVKKVLGAYRVDLIFQFLSESFLFNIVAIMISSLLVLIFIPSFNNLLDKEIILSVRHLYLLFFIIIGILIVGTIFSGLYPAFMLSSFKSVQILKGRFSTSSKGNILRRLLVLIQFFIAISILSSVFIIVYQLNYMKSQDIGYDMDGILNVKMPRSDYDSTYLYSVSVFQEKLKSYPAIEDVSATKIIPGQENPYFMAGMIRRSRSNINNDHTFYSFLADYSFIPTYDIELIGGRNFSKKHASDIEGIIIDEAALMLLNYANVDEALMDEVYVRGQKRRIIGVIKNYAQQSLKFEHCPTIIELIDKPRDVRFLSLKIDHAKSQEAISIVSGIWEDTFHEQPFDYFFLKEYYNKQYNSENKLIKILVLFATLSLVISCLGIFGLSYFEMLKRTKELGIRKVLGADILSIIILSSKHYIVLIGVSFLLAVPMVKYFMDQWLNNFATRIDISLLYFILPLLIVSLVAILTILYNIFKIAKISPTKSLVIE